MYDAVELHTYKLLRPVLHKADFLFRDFGLGKGGVPGTVSLDAAMSYLGTFLQPKIEFRRVRSHSTDASALGANAVGCKGGILLPMYLIAIYDEDPSTRSLRVAEDSPVWTQCQTIAVDLRKGRELIMCENEEYAIPYSTETLENKCSNRICWTYRVFIFQ
jgi:hypothetical protein